MNPATLTTFKKNSQYTSEEHNESEELQCIAHNTQDTIPFTLPEYDAKLLSMKRICKTWPVLREKVSNWDRPIPATGISEDVTVGIIMMPKDKKKNTPEIKR